MLGRTGRRATLLSSCPSGGARSLAGKAGAAAPGDGLNKVSRTVTEPKSQGASQAMLFATGRYLDLYRFENGAALLAERIVVCDSSRIDTLLAIPL